MEGVKYMERVSYCPFCGYELKHKVEKKDV